MVTGVQMKKKKHVFRVSEGCVTSSNGIKWNIKKKNTADRQKTFLSNLFLVYFHAFLSYLLV